MEIKIYLAFSQELEADRICLEDLIHKLISIYQNRNFCIHLIKGNLVNFKYESKQAHTEYEGKTMWVALFHQEARERTVQQLDEALEFYKENGIPKIYVYMKRLKQEDGQNMALGQVKEKLSNELGYFWCNYEWVDELLLHFMMQFQLLISDENNELEIRNTKICLGGEQIADLNHLPFIFKNQDYKWWQEKAALLEKEIQHLQEAMNVLSVQEAVRKILFEKQIELGKVRKQLRGQERILFQTALTIVRMQNQGFSERLRLAVRFFENGDNKGASALLDLREIQAEAESDRQSFDRAREISEKLLEEKRKALRVRVGELRMKASLILTDWQDDKRITEACRVFHLAVELAEHRYKKREYAELLHDYAHFVHGNGFIEKAIEAYQAALGWHYELSYDELGVSSFKLLLAMECGCSFGLDNNIPPSVSGFGFPHFADSGRVKIGMTKQNIVTEIFKGIIIKFAPIVFF